MRRRTILTTAIPSSLLALSAGHFLTTTDISSAHFAVVYMQSADFVAADMSPVDFTAAAVDARVAVIGRSESERQNAG